MSDLTRSYPTQQRVRELFEYSIPHQGLVWKVSRSKAKAGSLAGAEDKDGYLVIGLDGQRYKAHRLVFLFHYGRVPAGQLDHVDCNKKNNLIENLREADGSQNRCNVRLQRVNSTGFKGVNYNKRARKYRAIIKARGMTRFLGYFDDPREAHAAYCSAAVEMHGEFARLS